MEAQAENLTTPALQQERIAKTPPDDNGEEEQDEEEMEENELDPSVLNDSSHLDLTVLLPKVATLVKVSLIYGTQDMGLDWEERLTTITDADCLNLAKALAASTSVQIFELNKGHMTGEQCKTLVREGLIKMPHLKSLNLAYNSIGDVGAKALARLLIDKESHAPKTLHTLKLCRNEIRNRGAKALAYALSINSYLIELDLRLNFIKNAGGQDFGHGLAENKALKVLLLGGNRLGPDACYVLGKMLMINKTLIYLDISSNMLGEKGEEFLAIGMRYNKTLLKLDVRLCKTGFQFQHDVMVHLKKNRSKLDYSLIDMEDYYPPESEQEIPTDDLENMASEEEEDEEEDEEEEEDEFEVLKPVTSTHHLCETCKCLFYASDDSGSIEELILEE